MTVSDKIIKWVDENKGWFKVSYLAEICTVDRGNFTRYMQTEIPEKCLPTIMEFIMPLGFTLGKSIKAIEDNNGVEIDDDNTETNVFDSEKSLGIKKSTLTTNTIPGYPTDFNGLLKMAKEGVDNIEVFKIAVGASKCNGNQKSMILSKLNQ